MAAPRSSSFVLARSRALRVGGFILSPSATLRVAGQGPRVKVERPAGRTTLAQGLWSARPVLADGEWMDLDYLSPTAALVSARPGPSLTLRPRRRRALTRGAGVPRAGAGKILPRPRRTVGGEKAGRPEPYTGGRGREPPRGRFCGCWSPWRSSSAAGWSLMLLRVVADARPRETGAGGADAGGARRGRSPKRERAASAPPSGEQCPALLAYRWAKRVPLLRSRQCLQFCDYSHTPRGAACPGGARP
jgi:hypothetical protein